MNDSILALLVFIEKNIKVKKQGSDPFSDFVPIFISIYLEFSREQIIFLMSQHLLLHLIL